MEALTHVTVEVGGRPAGVLKAKNEANATVRITSSTRIAGRKGRLRNSAP